MRGFYGSPNNLALYLGKVFPLAVAVAAWGSRRRRRWIYGLAALVMGMTLLLTYSRGAWVVGVPASLLFLFAVRGRRTLAVGVGLIVVVGVVVGALGRWRYAPNVVAGYNYGDDLFPAPALAVKLGHDPGPPAAGCGLGQFPVCLPDPLCASYGLGGVQSFASAQLCA